MSQADMVQSHSHGTETIGETPQMKPLGNVILIAQHAAFASINEIALTLAVEPSMIEDAFPYTLLQEGFIMLSGRDGSYVSRSTFRLIDTVDVAKFKICWELVIASVPIWRTRIIEVTSGNMMQVILPRTISWEHNEVLNIQRYLQDIAALAFGFGQDLSNSIIVRDLLKDDYYFVLSAHYAVYNSLSLYDALQKVEAIYYRRRAELSIPFKRFIEHLHADADYEAAAEAF